MTIFFPLERKAAEERMTKDDNLKYNYLYSKQDTKLLKFNK